MTGGRTANLTYDPLGRVASVDQGSSATRSRFLYDGDELAIEYDDAGNIKTRFMFAGEDEPILADPGGTLACTNGTRFLHADHQGSIVALADCWGNRQAVNTYDEYGIPGSANTGRFQYTGQMWMPEVGMYYYKARMYSPTLGRFMQTDPIGYKDQINLYEYVGDDPVNKVDPSGLTQVFIDIQRTSETVHSTMGTYTASNGTKSVSGFTLEPPRAADPHGNGTTSVRPGTYGAFVRDQSTSRRSYDSIELKGGVPASDGHMAHQIQIHVGNFPRDTLGCILVGTSQAANMVGGSKESFAGLMSLVKTTMTSDQAKGQSTSIVVRVSDAPKIELQKSN